MPARAYVNFLHGGSSGDPERCTLVLEYDGKEAQIEIPVPKPLYEKEPGTDAYRRELQQILEALQEVAASPQGVYWPRRV